MGVKVFVEGKADKNFITDYLIHLNTNFPNNFEIQETGGWTKLQKLDNQFNENTNDNGTNLVVFDANSNPQQRREEILAIQDSLEIDFELFLLPNDNDIGNLETLLENIINPDHQRIFSCFEDYKTCLQENPQYKIPSLKVKIYAYQDTLLSEQESNKGIAKEENRNYRNPDHWNLENTYLAPLKEFLSLHL